MEKQTKSLIDAMRPLQMENNLKMAKALEDSKYFTPDIEDIRVGYELEYNLSGEDWNKITVNLSDFYTGVVAEFGMENTQGLRVPYLNKEQIEAEGWIADSTSMLIADFSKEDTSEDYYIYRFKKDNYTLMYNMGSNILAVIVTDPSLEKDSDFGKMPIFRGECKDVNTFRWICKLLKINGQ